MIVWIVACSESLYVPTVENAAEPDKIPELNMGRKLYIKHCGSCHNLYRPEAYTAAKWTAQIEEMKTVAKITDEQAELIRLYVTGYKRTAVKG